MAQKLEPIQIAEAYMTAKEWIIQCGFHAEIDWQSEISIAAVTETSFLREAAWVVLCSGFREAVLRSKFPAITMAFRDWRSAGEICAHRSECRQRALVAFRHTQKIDGILAVADAISLGGFSQFHKRLVSEPLKAIRTLPYMGPVTSYHLAKNLGLPVAKPDRHLVRLARCYGFTCVQDFCATVAQVVGDSISVVDLVWWRFATLSLHHNTIGSPQRLAGERCQRAVKTGHFEVT